MNNNNNNMTQNKTYILNHIKNKNDIIDIIKMTITNNTFINTNNNFKFSLDSECGKNIKDFKRMSKYFEKIHKKKGKKFINNWLDDKDFIHLEWVSTFTESQIAGYVESLKQYKSHQRLYDNYVSSIKILMKESNPETRTKDIEFNPYYAPMDDDRVSDEMCKKIEYLPCYVKADRSQEYWFKKLVLNIEIDQPNIIDGKWNINKKQIEEADDLEDPAIYDFEDEEEDEEDEEEDVKSQPVSPPTKIKDYLSVKEFVEKIEEDVKESVYRKITVNIKDGKKIPIGEKNSMTPEEIKNSRGSGNTYSIYLKWIKNLYCIDFDNNIDIITENKLYNYLKKTNCYNTITKKGFHFYLYIDDLELFSQQQNVYSDNQFNKEDNPTGWAIDLLKTNNTWETDNREVRGEKVEVNWNEIKEYFDCDKMNFKNKPKIKKTKKIEPEPELKPETELEPEPEPEDGDLYNIVVGLLNRLDKKRFEYDYWLKVGIILHNTFKKGSQGLTLWDDWSKKDKKTYAGYDELYNKYQGFKITDDPLTLKTLKFWANEDNPSIQTLVEEMNKEVYYISNIDTFVVYNRKFKIYQHKKLEKAELYFRNRISWKETKTGLKKVYIFKEWLEYTKRNELREQIFNPDSEYGVVNHKFNDNGITNINECWNKWKGLPIRKEEADKSNIKDCQAILDHLKNILCKGDQVAYEYILSWLAFIVQKKKKTGVALCFKSKQGAGKGIFIEGYLRRIFGEYFYQTSDIEDLIGNFNVQSTCKLLINLNEASWGGNKKQDGKVLSLITEPKVIVREKNITNYQVDDYSNYIYDTNKDYFANINIGGRRHFCVECDDKYAGIQTEESKKYFDNILPDKNPEKVMAFAKFLYNRDISNFNPRNFKETELQQEQVEQGYDTFTNWWKKCLSEDDICGIPFDYGEQADVYIELGGKGGFLKSAIYQDYRDSCKGMYGNTLTSNIFWKRLDKITDKEDLRIKYDHKRPYCVKFKPIFELRKEFNIFTNYEYEWL